MRPVYLKEHIGFRNLSSFLKNGQMTVKLKKTEIFSRGFVRLFHRFSLNYYDETPAYLIIDHYCHFI